MIRVTIGGASGLALAALCVTVVLAGPASAQPRLSRFVIANSGGKSTGPGLQFYATGGQAIVGLSTGANLRLYHGFLSFSGSPVVGVDPPEPPGLPLELSIGPARPNPARSGVRFALALPQASRVRLQVFDLAGRATGDPVDQLFDAGYHDVAWRAPARAAGILFARLSVEGQRVVERKFVLMP